MNISITLKKQSRAHRDLAIEYYNRGEHDKAFEEFRTALEKLSEERYFFNQSALLERLRINRDEVYCYLFLGDLSNAMKILRESFQRRKGRSALWDLLRFLALFYAISFAVISLFLGVLTSLQLSAVISISFWGGFIGVLIIAPGAALRTYRTDRELKMLESELKLLSAFVLYAQGEYEKVLAQINEVPKMKDAAISVYLREKALKSQVRKRRFNDMRKKGKDIRDWINLGTLFFMAKKYEDAVECYTKALEIDPDNAYALTGKGRVYMEKKEYEKAIECYDRALRRDPKIVNAWLDEGTAYFYLGDLDKSIECYTKALEIDPDNAYALTGKGRVYMEKKEYEKAIECYDRALRRDPKIVNAWLDEGTAYFYLGDLDKSIECYTKALEIDPDNSTAKRLKDKTVRALNEKD